MITFILQLFGFIALLFLLALLRLKITKGDNPYPEPESKKD